MASIRTYTFTTEDLEAVCSTSMQATLRKLKEDGILSEAQYQHYDGTHGAVVLTHCSLIGSLRKTIFGEGKDDGTLNIQVVKLA
jgi:hypothetical protein